MKFIQTLLPIASLSIILGVAPNLAGAGQMPEQFGTPDNLPPPMEDICNMTTGAANGLCVAYCEAMDCDSDNPHASEKACTKTAENFTRITGEMPPCERVCPCWEASALNAVTAENQLLPGDLSCVDNGFAEVIQTNTPLPNGQEGGFAVGNLQGDGNPLCATRDLPPFLLEVTPEEGQVCSQQIRARCEEIGTPIL